MQRIEAAKKVEARLKAEARKMREQHKMNPLIQKKISEAKKRKVIVNQYLDRLLELDKKDKVTEVAYFNQKGQEIKTDDESKLAAKRERIAISAANSSLQLSFKMDEAVTKTKRQGKKKAGIGLKSFPEY